jgi:hypothetical protein
MCIRRFAILEHHLPSTPLEYDFSNIRVKYGKQKENLNSWKQQTLMGNTISGSKVTAKLADN